MTESSAARLPRLSAEQRRAAAAQFERAKQVLTAGDYDYGLQLLLNCCLIDPASPIYRQALRQAQRGRLDNKPRGQKLAYVRTLRPRWRLQRAMSRGDHKEALHQAELILMRDPWDLSTHLRMADIFEQLNLRDLAIWTLEQLRPVRPVDPAVNRPLAQLYEARGNFTQAIQLWQLVKKARPDDLEAQHKAKDLAASATIAKGRYEQAVKGEAQTPLVQNAEAPAGETAETDPDRPAAATDLALPALQERVPREVEALQAKILANPTNANAYLQLAGFYRRHDQFDKARAVLTQGLGPTAQDFNVAQELADLAIEPFRRDLVVAEEQFRQQPANKELQEVRTRLTREINTRELDLYRRRAERFPTDTAARFEMGLRLLRAGQTDEAIRILQTVRNDPRHQARALFYLGFCFKTRNNWKLAQRNFEEALTGLGHDDATLRKEAMYQLAVGHAEAGELQQAVDLACELANLDYSFKNISTLLDEWQAKAAK